MTRIDGEDSWTGNLAPATSGRIQLIRLVGHLQRRFSRGRDSTSDSRACPAELFVERVVAAYVAVEALLKVSKWLSDRHPERNAQL